MKHILFGIKYLFNYWIYGENKPLICGLVLHNKCNLRCRHCTVVNRPEDTMSYREAIEVMDAFYAEGGRCLYLEGGEPFIWKDEAHTMEDIVSYAHQKGFLTVVVYTNGLQAINSEADTIFVSLDGLKETHDSLRGKSFDRIMGNIEKSIHPSIYINYTINSVNHSGIDDFCGFVDKISQIKGTFFYFHTPYYGIDELYLDRNRRTEILYHLLALKKKYKILNSAAGLRSAIRDDWKKKLGICKVYEGGKYYLCCRENMDGEVCNHCGYLSYAEIEQTLKLNPGAVLNALKYF